MGLGQLSIAPASLEDLAWLSFANMDEHTKVAAAIAASDKYQHQNVRVDPLDPIPIGDEGQMEEWLRIHYDGHSAINAVLGINGADISSVDFNDPAQLAAWTLLHYSEHSQWQSLLGTT